MSLPRRLGPWLLALALPIVGCQDRSAVDGGTAHERAVDTALFSFLSKARSAHHLADLALQGGDRPGAIRQLEQLTDGPRPAGAPEVLEVLADAHARIADLRSQEGAFDAALREVDEGLSLAVEPTHYRGHLFEVRGLVEERRMQSLLERGDAAGAAAARKAALEAFETAIDVQDEVIRRALDTSPSVAP